MNCESSVNELKEEIFFVHFLYEVKCNTFGEFAIWNFKSLPYNPC